MTDPGIRVALVPGVERADRETGELIPTLPATWPKYDNAPRWPVVSLCEALTTHWHPDGRCDGRCYIAQHAPMREHGGRAPRLATTAWRHDGGVRMQLLLTDVDAHDKHRPGFDARAWWPEQSEALAELDRRWPGAFVACSRGGLRIYQVLRGSFTIDSLERADEWKARYTAWVGLVSALPWRRAAVDGSTKDWARLQRIPHDTRSGVLQLLPTRGDPAAVGLVELPPPAPRPPAPEQRAYVGPPVPRKVERRLLERLAALLPRQGEGVHESALALGGVLAASHWSTDDCVEVVEVVFAMAGVVREDIGRSARWSIDNARSGSRAYGWPRLRALCVEHREKDKVFNAMQRTIPGLERNQDGY